MSTREIQNQGAFSHIPEFDGLRALAIALVLITHANFQLGANGILGVDIFFTLSGFLITSLLYNEFNSKGSYSVKAFYVRRFFRLMPSLILVVLFVFLYGIIFESPEIKSIITSEVIFSVLYLSNLSWIWEAKNYLLAHTWSLANEEQFYIFFPVFFLIFLRRGSSVLFGIFLGLLSLLLLFMKLFGVTGPIINSLLMESLFFGCSASILFYSGKIKFKISDFFTLILLVFILIVGVFPVQAYMQLYNSGGRGLVGLLSCFIIVGILQNPGGVVSRILSTPLTLIIGQISYSLYLWHVPIFRLFKIYSPFSPPINFISKFIFTFFISILSFYFLEKPLIRFGKKISARLNHVLPTRVVD